MDFRTTFDIAPYDFILNFSSKGMIVGSCFAENIGRKLQRYKMQTTINPMGVVFNPISVCNTLEMLHAELSPSGASAKQFTQSDIFQYGGLWHSPFHHSSFSDQDPQRALDRMNQSASEASKALAECDYVIITLGTAWVYEHKASGVVVSNCHKLPAAEFNRRLMSVGEVTQVMARILGGCLKDKKVIVTVSPIRHIRDGAHENQISKSTLIVALEELAREHKNLYYFPAYELMMDDLRDYRFYGDDMCHPSPQAVEYIWDRFSQTVFDKNTHQVFADIDKILSAADHRPFNATSEQHRNFKRKMAAAAGDFMKKYPFVNLKNELEYFEAE